MKGSISVDINMPSPRLSSWNLMRETSANPKSDEFAAHDALRSKKDNSAVNNP